MLLTGLLCVILALVRLETLGVRLALGFMLLFQVFALLRWVDGRQPSKVEFAARDLGWAVVLPVLWVCLNPLRIPEFFGGYQQFPMPIVAYAHLGMQITLVVCLVLVHPRDAKAQAVLGGLCLASMSLPAKIAMWAPGLVWMFWDLSEPPYRINLCMVALAAMMNCYCLWARCFQLHKSAEKQLENRRSKMVCNRWALVRIRAAACWLSGGPSDLFSAG